jgi:hypothetical protein
MKVVLGESKRLFVQDYIQTLYLISKIFGESLIKSPTPYGIWTSQWLEYILKILFTPSQIPTLSSMGSEDIEFLLPYTDGVAILVVRSPAA